MENENYYKAVSDTIYGLIEYDLNNELDHLNKVLHKMELKGLHPSKGNVIKGLRGVYTVSYCLFTETNCLVYVFGNAK